jgi:hypothetical protein
MIVSAYLTHDANGTADKYPQEDHATYQSDHR